MAETWPVAPSLPSTLELPVVHLHVASGQGEIFALEAGGTRVAVLNKWGAVLRRFGEGQLQQASASAVVYAGRPPSVDGAGSVLVEPDAVSLLVADPSAGLIHRFSIEGDPIGQSSDLKRPTRLLDWNPQPPGEEPLRAIAIDATADRVTLLDFEARRIRDLDLSALDPPLLKPAALAVTDDGQFGGPGSSYFIHILDAARRAVDRLEATGARRESVDVHAPAGADLSTANLIASDGQIFVLTADAASTDNGRLRHLSTDPDRVTIDTAFRLDPNDIRGANSASLYGIRLGDGQLQMLLQDQGAIYDGCLAAADLAPDPWRVVADGRGTIRVLHANGSLRSVGPDSHSDAGWDLGLVDDLSVLSSGHIYTMRDGDGPVYAQGPYGLTTIRREPWYVGLDCMESGVGPRASIGVAEPAGQSRDWLALLSPFEIVREPESPPVTYDQRWREVDAANPMHAFDWLVSRLWRAEAEPPHPRFLSDIALSADGSRSALIERLEGRVYVDELPADPDQPPDPPSAWPVPGRPMRLHWSPEGHLFILTAEGWVFELDGMGQIVSAWDAAAAEEGKDSTGVAGADLVDIAVDERGRPLLLDRAGRVLVFEPQAPADPLPPAAAVELPPPCTLTTHALASTQRSPIHEPVTVTLGVDGSCGRSTAESDIVILLQSQIAHWEPGVLRSGIEAFIDELDPDKDRLALMHFDERAEIMVPLSADFSQVLDAYDATASRKPAYPSTGFRPSPLDAARRYLASAGRPGAYKVVILVTDGLFKRADPNPFIGLVHDANRLRREGTRVIVIMPWVRYSLLPARLASQPEDLYIKPDEARLREAYAQLGREFGAHYLAREATLVERIAPGFDYDPGSASPPADWDPDARTLAWRIERVPFGGLRATYRSLPRWLGERPLSIGALIGFIDGFGNRGTASFPIPWVEVYEAPTATPTAEPTPTPAPPEIYLPMLLCRTCRPGPTAR